MAAGGLSAEHMMSKSLPAPKTFAPSREDILSNLAFFFGDPAVPEKLRDYSEHHAMTYHFPVSSAPLTPPCPIHARAHAHGVCIVPTGRVLRPEHQCEHAVEYAPRTPCKRALTRRAVLLAEIRETLSNLILKSPQEWQTSVGLPFV